MSLAQEKRKGTKKMSFEFLFGASERAPKYTAMLQVAATHRTGAFSRPLGAKIASGSRRHGGRILSPIEPPGPNDRRQSEPANRDTSMFVHFGIDTKLFCDNFGRSRRRSRRRLVISFFVRCYWDQRRVPTANGGKVMEGETTGRMEFPEGRGGYCS